MHYEFLLFALKLGFFALQCRMFLYSFFYCQPTRLHESCAMCDPNRWDNILGTQPFNDIELLQTRLRKYLYISLKRILKWSYQLDSTRLYFDTCLKYKLYPTWLVRQFLIFIIRHSVWVEEREIFLFSESTDSQTRFFLLNPVDQDFLSVAFHFIPL